ncbi:hypothetical protein Vretimale_19231 [Volvox reticuliferus]|uniref:SPX domain-containing protein n=1 Tax=Volvox reticuliferus TaxID=1737510 RepID=A0A8J4D0M6_9CHLO|nr:hypothetical protein Vretifemale_20290 [Volvox reticuliferus]GIM16609.1 hypothetical protein Vretimale_19231 [Volvox reticuliferus]
MKFGKVLKVSSENMPMEMHDLFLRYKELKKQIKMIPVSKDAAAGEKQASVSSDGSATGSGSAGAAITATVLSPEEQAFITTLNEDLARFNRYFIEKEEEAVIRIQALCDDLARAAGAAGLHLPASLINVATSLSEQEGGIGQLNLGSDLVSFAAPAARVDAAQLQQHEEGEEHELEEEEKAAATAMAMASPDASVRPDIELGEAAAAVAAAVASSAVREQQEQGTRVDYQQQYHHHHHHHHHAHRSHHHTGPGSSSPFGPHLAELQEVKSRLVQFHGEMVLLLHWSLLNYAAVVKILKKHDKRTGVLLRAPYLANVLQQPFSSTTIMSRLAKRAEELVVATTQLSPAGVGGGGLPAGIAAVVTTAAPAAEKSCLQLGSSSVHGHTATFSTGGAPAAAAVAPAMAPSGRGAAAASDASTPTCAEERDGSFVDVNGHPEPLVGSTMHALETWANLRKNAITPSTVLAAEVEQPLVPPSQQQQQQQHPQVPSKRKAENPSPEPVPEAEFAAQETKVAKLADEQRSTE